MKACSPDLVVQSKGPQQWDQSIITFIKILFVPFVLPYALEFNVYHENIFSLTNSFTYLPQYSTAEKWSHSVLQPSLSLIILLLYILFLSKTSSSRQLIDDVKLFRFWCLTWVHCSPRQSEACEKFIIHSIPNLKSPIWWFAPSHPWFHPLNRLYAHTSRSIKVHGLTDIQDSSNIHTYTHNTCITMPDFSTPISLHFPGYGQAWGGDSNCTS